MRFAYSSGGVWSSLSLVAAGAGSEGSEVEVEVDEEGGGRGGSGGYIPGVTNDPGARMSVRMLNERTSAERVSV